KILLIVTELFDQHWSEQPVRLIGVTVQVILYTSDIHEQLSLFTYNQSIKQNNFDMTVAELTKKLGKDVFKTNKDEDESSRSDAELVRTSVQKDVLNDYKNKKT